MRARLAWLIASLFVVGIPGLAARGSVTDVTVDGARRYQTVEGFGTCLIAWVDRFRSLYRTEEFQKVYVQGVGCNMLRVNLWGPTFEKPTDNWTRIRCEDFDMNAAGGRPQIFIDFGRGIRKLDPNVRIIGTVWSPPAWMKVNKSITDTKSSAIRAGGYGGSNNRVDPKYFRHFCKWMVEYVKLHDKQGVPFYAVSPGDLTIVALNPTDQEQVLSLAFHNLTGLTLLKAFRTSASENLKEIGDVAVKDDKAAFPMTALSIVTFSGRIAP